MFSLRAILLIIMIFFLIDGRSQSNTDHFPQKLWTIKCNIHSGYVVENSASVPKSNHPFLIEINPSIQTNGSKNWQQIFKFPEIGCSFFYGNLGNNEVLGSLLGIVPNITFNSMNPHWYVPRTSLGLGFAFFNKPFRENTNPTNTYIGSSITAMAYAKVYIQGNIRNHLSLSAGFMVSHCSNGHYQVPNVGLNLPSIFVGIAYLPLRLPNNFEKREINIPKSNLRFNIRTGIGVHVLAQTLGPTGTSKYAIYVNDVYVSKRFGKASNVQAGLEMNFYNSYYNYIVKNGFFQENQKSKATVVTFFLAHELMINRFSLLTQGGINLYNPFYNEYIKMYKSEQGIQTDLKKIFSTRLGVQYYLFDTKYCTRNNLFIGAYIKANFGQADFICTQIG